MISAEQNKAVKEAIDTEESYYNKLTFLEMVLNQNELVRDNPILVAFKDMVIQLKAHSEQVQQNIGAALNTPENLSIINTQRAQLAKAFFVVYPRYSENYTRYVAELAQNPELFQAINQFVFESKGCQLESFLIEPIQRGPRYAMLISAVISYSEKLPEGDNGKLSNEKIEELRALSNLVQDHLVTSNLKTPKISTGYRFGDLTRAGISYFLGSRSSTEPEETAQKSEETSLIEDFSFLG